MKKVRTIIFLFFFAIIALFIWWQNGNQIASPQDKTEKIFVITPKENIRDIVFNLKKENLIRDPIIFFLIVKQLALDGKIQAGDFRLSPSMTPQDIAKTLTHGMLDIWVTIPEGKRAEEIAQILESKIPSYLPTWKKELNSQEGYLFPDTYYLPRNADVNLVINLMKQNFQQKFETAKNGKITKLTDNEIITVASIIEREAIFPEDRAYVASVIFNRLAYPMRLQIDPTIQYALDYQTVEKTWWKKTLTVNDLQTDSPYNTYQNDGLPLGPICNPGFSALSAAINPAKTDYLYYISDQKGHLHFARTLEEHNVNIQKYGE